MRDSGLHRWLGMEGIPRSWERSRESLFPRVYARADRLPSPPFFSPATKADEGHDENITTAEMGTIVGSDHAASSSV